MTNSRAKGTAGERELAQLLREILGQDGIRRGQQYCGANGDADVIGVPGVHLESKRYKRHACIDHVRQALTDSAGSGDAPLACLRENGDTDWYGLFRLKDWAKIARAYATATGKPVFPEGE